MSKYSICDVSLGEHRADGKMRLAFGKPCGGWPAARSTQHYSLERPCWSFVASLSFHCLRILALDAYQVMPAQSPQLPWWLCCMLGPQSRLCAGQVFHFPEMILSDWAPCQEQIQAAQSLTRNKADVLGALHRCEWHRWIWANLENTD